MQAYPVGLARLALISLLGAAILESGTARCEARPAPVPQASAGCPRDESGLKLPPGFCATVFADETGHARHVVVSPDGVVYLNTWSGRYYAGDGQPEPPDRGFLVALKDTRGSGRADVNQRFGETPNTGGAGGTGIALYDGFLYVEINDKIVRYTLAHGSIVPKGPPQTVVTGLPLGGDHPMHPFAIDAGGSLYVDVASATNSCQIKNRTLNSPGRDPCVELETRGGIWRFDARRLNQAFTPGARFATGIRNGEGFALDTAAQRVFLTQHGRDQLRANWPDLYQAEEEATLPAEEVLLLSKAADFGWPECYYDPGQKKLVLAPEYGGDGGRKVGPCAAKTGPVAAFPAHWAPNDLLYYDKQAFPVRYRNGLFIAFHGSWDRAPYGQQGYNVVYQSLDGDRAGGTCEIFADGFAGAIKTPGTAIHRPSGLALGPDGALYISDDVRGRIYRIVYIGGAAQAGAGEAARCPDPAAAAGPVLALSDKPPEGTNPDAGAKLPVPSALRPTWWLWAIASFTARWAVRPARVVTGPMGRERPYRSPMPPLGGAQLSTEQVKALAAYVWGLSHRHE